MSAQYDVLPGFDLSSVTSPTRTQHIQAISQLAPLSNIGGVIFSPTTPDVANNQRFKRYIWLDSSITTEPPVPKYYDIDETAGAGAAANWQAIPVAALSLTNTQISATAEIEVSKLKDGAANEIISTAADGVTVNWTSVASLLAALNDAIPLTAIDDSAAVGAESFLRRVGSTVIFKTFAETVVAIQAALNGVSPSVFTPGANNTILGTSGVGVVAFNTPANILANEAITLALLAAGGGSSLQVLARNTGNTAWSPQTLALNLLNAAPISTTGITVGAMGGAAVFTQAHSLGAKPKLVRIVCICTTIDVGYAVGDELDIYALRIAANNFNSSAVTSDGTNITVTLAGGAAGNEIPNKGTGVYAAMTEASWSLKIYAWI